MTPLFAKRLSVPTHVLVRELNGESVILNLESGNYFGLDEVGTRMIAALSTSDRIQAAYDVLAAEYNVDPDLLHEDIRVLIEKLVERGLVELHEAL
jgi:hypothetical protein